MEFSIKNPGSINHGVREYNFRHPVFKKFTVNCPSNLWSRGTTRIWRKRKKTQSEEKNIKGQDRTYKVNLRKYALSLIWKKASRGTPGEVKAGHMLDEVEIPLILIGWGWNGLGIKPIAKIRFSIRSCYCRLDLEAHWWSVPIFCIQNVQLHKILHKGSVIS